MRRLRSDLPYTFRPPRLRRWFRPLAWRVNRRFLLERKYRVESIAIEGFDGLPERVAAGDAVVFAPNHADHADPHVMIEVGRRLGLDLHFMAAREVFETSTVSAGIPEVGRSAPNARLP